MTPYTEDYFKHTAALSMDAMTSLTGDIGLKGDIDAAEGLIAWLEQLSDDEIRALPDRYWNDSAVGSNASSDNMKSVRLNTYKGGFYTSTYTPVPTMLSAVIWPRDSIDPTQIETGEVPLNVRQRSYFERAAKALQRVQDLHPEAGKSWGVNPYDEFTTHSIGHIRDTSALAWLCDFRGGPDELAKIQASLWRPVYVSSDKGTWEGMTSYLAGQVNPSAINMLMDKDSSWGQRILFAWNERIEQYSHGGSRMDALWSNAVTQESLKGTDTHPKSLLSTFERMTHASDSEIGLGHTLTFITALLEKRLEHDKGGHAPLPVVDRLLRGLPDDAPEILAQKYTSTVQLNSIVKYAREATEACHIDCLRLLGPALQGPLLHAEKFWPGRKNEHGLFGSLISGAIARDDIPLGDIADTAKYLVSCGMKIENITTDNYGNILHAMANAGKKGGKEVLPKMMIFVDLGANAEEKDDRGWKPGSYLDASVRPRWENLLKVHKSAQAARDALAEIGEELLAPGRRP